MSPCTGMITGRSLFDLVSGRKIILLTPSEQGSGALNVPEGKKESNNMKTSAEIVDYAIRQFNDGADFVNIGINGGEFEIWNPESETPPEITITRGFYMMFCHDDAMKTADFRAYLNVVKQNMINLFGSTNCGYLTLTISAGG